jgi:hypothetical protein
MTILISQHFNILHFIYNVNGLQVFIYTFNYHNISQGVKPIQRVGFEVLKAVSTKMAVFWVVAPCSLVEVSIFPIQMVGFEVLKAVSTKMAVFWVVAPCSLVDVSIFPIQMVGFEVLKAVSTKMAVFWVVAPCSLVEVSIFPIQMDPAFQPSSVVYKHACTD